MVGDTAGEPIDTRHHQNIAGAQEIEHRASRSAVAERIGVAVKRRRAAEMGVEDA